MLNLGFLDLPRDQWKELANTIESELHSHQSLFSQNSEIEKLAKHYASVIIKEKLNKESERVEGQRDKTESESLFETVDINSVSTSDSRSIGVEHVVTSSMQEYNLDKVLKKLKFNENQVDYARMLIAGRLAHPASERETVRWINENSAIRELLKTDAKVYDNTLHSNNFIFYKTTRKKKSTNLYSITVSKETTMTSSCSGIFSGGCLEPVPAYAIVSIVNSFSAPMGR